MASLRLVYFVPEGSTVDAVPFLRMIRNDTGYMQYAASHLLSLFLTYNGASSGGEPMVNVGRVAAEEGGDRTNRGASVYSGTNTSRGGATAEEGGNGESRNGPTEEEMQLLGGELNDDVLAVLGSVAKVRSLMKAKRKVTKQRRASRSREREAKLLKKRTFATGDSVHGCCHDEPRSRWAELDAGWAKATKVASGGAEDGSTKALADLHSEAQRTGGVALDST
ncbi:V-type proton ATPase subunit H [Phytophthora pseudosyringae]|uniref:V-type proton ATPase subunit H n=1 Tax=Phytophthora pseudosyringae TaxID=221518 RepID=A0A8T1W6Z2_9STRA|nr:V-type proton ATPase subunit H [Phytophthora pseudosyringae]